MELPTLGPDSWNPMARPCLSPNLSERRVLARGRWTPWKRPTRNLRRKRWAKPAARKLRAVATAYPTIPMVRVLLMPMRLAMAPAGILMTM